MKAWTEAERSRSKPIRRAKRIRARYCEWRSTLIDYRVADGIARITLNRPEKRNALNSDLIEALKNALALSAEDSEVRIVLLKGAGSDFCSGADLAGLDRTAEDGR